MSDRSGKRKKNVVGNEGREGECVEPEKRAGRSETSAVNATANSRKLRRRDAGSNATNENATGNSGRSDRSERTERSELRSDRSNRDMKETHRPTILAETLSVRQYERSEQQKRRLRDARRRWKSQKNRVNAALHAAQGRQLQRDRNALLAIYEAQIDHLERFVMELELSSVTWSDTHLHGGRTEQMARWLKQDRKRLQKLRQVYSDIATRYSDRALGLEPLQDDDSDDVAGTQSDEQAREPSSVQSDEEAEQGVQEAMNAILIAVDTAPSSRAPPTAQSTQPALVQTAPQQASPLSSPPPSPPPSPRRSLRNDAPRPFDPRSVNRMIITLGNPPPAMRYRPDLPRRPYVAKSTPR